MTSATIIPIIRVTNITPIVQNYAESIQSSYDAMKIDRVQKRYDDISSKIDSQLDIAKQANELLGPESMNSFALQIKNLADFFETEYEKRTFLETKDSVSNNKTGNSEVGNKKAAPQETELVDE